MPEKFLYDVFLSHNSGDKPRVQRLAKQLQESGLRVWFDEWAIKPGDDIYMQVERGLETSRTLILCMSPAAFGSDWVSLERSTALFRDPINRHRRFIPLLLVDCVLPDTLRRYKYIDYREEGRTSLEQLLAACTHIDPPISAPVRSVSDEIPEPIRELLEDARRLADQGRYASAKIKCEQALQCAQEDNHALAEVKAKISLAGTLRVDSPEAARNLYRECMDQLKTIHSEKLREEVLGQLGDLEAMAGNLLEARSLLTEALVIARRLEDRCSIASNIQALALLADGEGRSDEAITLYDEAIELFMAEYQGHDTATEGKAIRGLGVAFNNKSVAQKHQADLIGALTSLEQAISWLRQSDSQDDLARALYLLAEAKFAGAKWQEGAENLNEALELATELDDYIWMSHCMRLFGRLSYTLGREAEAQRYFERALALMREKGRPNEVLDCLGTVANIYASKGMKAEAKNLLDEAKNLSEEHGLLEAWVDSVLGISKLEEGPDADAKREEAVTQAIQALERLLVKTQVKGRRAFLMGRIGSLYQKIESWEEALSWLEMARKAFTEINDVHGIVNCLGSISEIRHAQNESDAELETYRQILSLARGKAMPKLLAGTKINMGNALVSRGKFRDAKRLFEEAADICEKHHIREFQSALLSNLERVEHFLSAYGPVDLDFSQLVRELHELVAFFPEARDSILRFWYYTRDAELHANCRSLIGLKLLIAEDRTEKFLEMAGKLAVYGDLYLHVVDTEFPGTGMDFVPYPKDRPLPKRVALPTARREGDAMYVDFLRGGLHWPYSLTSDEACSKESGQVGVVIFGLAGGLPPQAHELMLGHSGDELIEKKTLFFPFDRSIAEERLLNDLRLAKEQLLVPVYRGRLPESEDVEVIASVMAKLPVVPVDRVEEFRSQIVVVKRRLVRLLSANEREAFDALSEVAADLEEVYRSSHPKEALAVRLYLLRFTILGDMQSHLAVVVYSD